MFNYLKVHRKILPLCKVTIQNQRFSNKSIIFTLNRKFSDDTDKEIMKLLMKDQKEKRSRGI